MNFGCGSILGFFLGIALAKRFFRWFGIGDLNPLSHALWRLELLPYCPVDAFGSG